LEAAAMSIPAQTQLMVERFQAAFAVLDPGAPFPVDALYDPDVRFVDPFHHIEGRDALGAYFNRLNRNVASCTFTFHTTVIQGDDAMLTWTMRLRMKRWPTDELALPGCSHLVRGELCRRHTDYFDAGAMVYERVPLLGAMVRLVKRSL
jgi:hypothetical protein